MKSCVGISPRPAAKKKEDSVVKRVIGILIMAFLLVTLCGCPKSDSQSEKKEIIDSNLMLSEELEPVYDEYSETLDDEVLRGLDPIDILRIRNKAVEEENIAVLTSLVIVPEEVKREDFENEVGVDKISMENDKKLVEKYKDFNGKVIETTVSKNEKYLEIEDDGFWRFEKTESGIWKLGWLARQ